jgi:DNA-binding CsgD family transcriptional regulator/AraC-like DNA-binding protein
MRNSDTENRHTFPSAMGVMTRLACGRARQEGVEVELLLQKAGLTSQQVDDPNARLDVKGQIKFLELAATALNDECLGFHLAQKSDLRMLGLTYYVMASSDTLGEALHRAVRYCTIVNEGIALRLREGKNIGIGFEYVGVARHPDRHQIEGAMVALVRMCRQLTGNNLPASRVSFTHRRDQDISEFRTFFGGDVVFGAAVDEATFSPSIRQMPVVSADPYLNELLIKYCDQALAARPTKRSSFGVETAIALLLPHGKPQANEIARKIGVSRHTLARRLSSEGLTFGDLLRNVKSDLAERHLADETLTIPEIAWLLGYQDIHAFAQAFIKSKALEATLDALTAGVYLADRHGRIIYMNRAAAGQVETGHVVRIQDNRLAPVDDDAHAAMRKGLKQAMADGAATKSVTLALPSDDGSSLVATILPLSQKLGSCDAFAAIAAIFVQDPSSVPSLRGKSFANLHGLTDAELRVLLAMAPGLSVKEAAELLGISETTAKTHLQHIHTKTGTSKQTELMHLFMTSAPPVQVD